MSPEMQKVVDEQINEWLRDGIISRSDSPFARCLHVVPKNLVNIVFVLITDV